MRANNSIKAWRRGVVSQVGYIVLKSLIWLSFSSFCLWCQYFKPMRSPQTELQTVNAAAIMALLSRGYCQKPCEGISGYALLPGSQREELHPWYVSE